MPYSRYICPDGQCTNIADCLKKCRIASRFESERCLSKRTLMAIADQRPWTGTPSTTMLLSGTRSEFLKLIHDYPVDPQDCIWMLFGSGVHGHLEKYMPDNSSSEERIFAEHSSGAYDHYDEEEEALFDVKTYGSYKTAKILGLKKVKDPVMGFDGQQEKWGNGKKKFNTYYVVGRRDRLEVAMQLNDYRMKIENEPAYDKLGNEYYRKVRMMVIEIITRDAGTYIAADRGIKQNAQLVRVNRISDRWIERYNRKKSQDLCYYVNKFFDEGILEMPPPCKPREIWGGLKCQKYCAVWMHCDKGREAKGVKSTDDIII